MGVLSRFDTVIFLFLLLGFTSAAAFFKVPINEMVFGALLLALNANGKNGNGNGANGTKNPSEVGVPGDAPKAS